MSSRTPPVRIEHDEGPEAHYLHAYLDGEPNQVGVIAWSKEHGGLIFEAWTDERYRRRGIATLLWQTARAGGYEPPIRMSPNATPDGLPWARSLGTGVTMRIWDGSDYWGSD